MRSNSQLMGYGLMAFACVALGVSGKSRLTVVQAQTIKQTQVSRVKLSSTTTAMDTQTTVTTVQATYPNYYVTKKKLSLYNAKYRHQVAQLKAGSVIKVMQKHGKNARICVIKPKGGHKYYYVKQYLKYIYLTRINQLTKQQKKVLLATAQKWKKHLTQAQRQTIRAYTGHAYININGYYRRHQSVSVLVRRQGALLSQALRNFSLPYAATYYRGTTAAALRNITHQQHLMLGTPMRDFGFASATIDCDMAEDFAHNYLLVLNVPARRQVGAYIAVTSLLPEEDEFLFKRKTGFVITQLGKLHETTYERVVEKRHGKVIKISKSKWRVSYPVVIANLK